MNGSKILNFRKVYLIFICENIFWLLKIFLIMEKVLSVESFLDQGIFFFWKASLFVENFFDHGQIYVCKKLPWSWKNVCLWKTFLTTEKIIGLIFLKTNTNVETIKFYFLSMEQKPNSLVFFAVDRIKIIFKWALKYKC